MKKIHQFRQKKIKRYKLLVENKTIPFKKIRYVYSKPLWDVFKFKGNTAWYAICKECNYTYQCSIETDKEIDGVSTPVTTLRQIYNFCPCCGKEYDGGYYNDYTDIFLPMPEVDYDYKDLMELKKMYNKLDRKRQEKTEGVI